MITSPAKATLITVRKALENLPGASVTPDSFSLMLQITDPNYDPDGFVLTAPDKAYFHMRAESNGWSLTGSPDTYDMFYEDEDDEVEDTTFGIDGEEFVISNQGMLEATMMGSLPYEPVMGEDNTPIDEWLITAITRWYNKHIN